MGWFMGHLSELLALTTMCCFGLFEFFLLCSPRGSAIAVIRSIEDEVTNQVVEVGSWCLCSCR